MGMARVVQDSQRGQSLREKIKTISKRTKELPDREVKKFKSLLLQQRLQAELINTSSPEAFP